MSSSIRNAIAFSNVFTYEEHTLNLPQDLLQKAKQVEANPLASSNAHELPVCAPTHPSDKEITSFVTEFLSYKPRTESVTPLAETAELPAAPLSARVKRPKKRNRIKSASTNGPKKYKDWKKEELDIIYEEMTYIGTINFNMKMASSRLNSRSESICVRAWNKHKMSLGNQEREEKYGKLYSRDRTLIPIKPTPGPSLFKEKASTLSPHNNNVSLNKRRKPQNVVVKAINRPIERSLDKEMSTVSTIQEMVLPIMNILYPSAFTFIQNQGCLNSESIAPYLLPSYVLPPLEIEMELFWKNKDFEKLVKCMIGPGTEEKNLRTASSILSRTVEQCRNGWVAHSVILVQYMNSLISQANYVPWSEEDNRMFASMLDISKLLSSLLSIEIKLKRPFLECFAKWEYCKNDLLINAPTRQPTELSGLDLLLAAIEKSGS